MSVSTDRTSTACAVICAVLALGATVAAFRSCSQAERASESARRSNEIAEQANAIAASQVDLANRQAKLHLEPELATYFDAPTNRPPLFVVANKGTIPATSVTAGYRRYTYDKDSRSIVGTTEPYLLFSPGAIYCEVLKPTERRELRLRLGKVAFATNLLEVYQFTVKYFRDTDMKEYSRTEWHFIDNGTLMPHREYVNRPEYANVMSRIEAHKTKPVDWPPGTLSSYLELMKKPQEGRPQQ